MTTPRKEVLILGGGFAGLSAAVELSSRGHHVTLIEKRGHLGGRAYSYREPITGTMLDNGQHILMGCYKDTLSFLEKIGTRNRVSFQRRLRVDFADQDGKKTTFKAFSLPSPYHLLGGFLSFKGLPWKDRLSAFGLKKILEEDSSLDQKNVTQWLTELKQPKTLQDRFWNPLTLAALNDVPEKSSAALFSAVLRESFGAGAAGSRIGVPKSGLSDLYTEAARDFVERKGGQFLLKTSVTKLHFRGREFSEIELEGGRRMSAENLLVTVPFTALRKLLPESLLYGDSFFAPLFHLNTSPIVAVNLWFDRPVLKRPFVGLWGTQIQWIFNRGSYLSLVVSGAREELKMPGPRLVELAIAELHRALPASQKARVIKSVVLKEPEATLAPAVGVSKFRLSQKTPYRHFYLAGDWTDTGLPATIESAVRSAKKAVELIEKAE